MPSRSCAGSSTTNAAVPPEPTAPPGPQAHGVAQDAEQGFRYSRSVNLEQQRFWVALLNLQRAWSSDEAALTLLPPRHRDFTSAPDWPQRKALAYLLNNLELIRENHRRLERGEPLEVDLLNASLETLKLRLFAWTDLGERRRAAQARADFGGRLETLQVTSGREGLNPGTRYVRATVERCLYYFAQYVDERLSDPAYPDCSPGRLRVAESVAAGGDLVLESPSPVPSA